MRYLLLNPDCATAQPGPLFEANQHVGWERRSTCPAGFPQGCPMGWVGLVEPWPRQAPMHHRFMVLVCRLISDAGSSP